MFCHFRENNLINLSKVAKIALKFVFRLKRFLHKILKLACWVCGTNPSTLERNRAPAHQELSVKSSEAELGLAQGLHREIGNLLPNNRRQRRTCYALCHILYPVSAAHTSIFRMDSNSTSYRPA